MRVERESPRRGSREAEEWLRLALEAAGMATWDWDLATGNVTRSGGMAALYGLPPGSLGDAAVATLDRVHPDDRHLILEMDARHLETGEPYVVEYRVVLSDGSIRWLREQGHHLPDPEGGPGRLLGVTTDVTRQKDAEAALREAEEQYRQLVEQLPAVIYISEYVPREGDPWSYRYMSPRLADLLGYSAEEWLADPTLWEQSLHPDDVDLVMAEDARTERTGEPYQIEHRMIARDGRVVWVRDEARLVEGRPGGQRAWQGVIINITKRKEAEAALAASEARYRALIEQLPAVVYRTPAAGPPLTYASVGLEELLGYSLSEWLSDPGLWSRIVHPEDRELAETVLRRSLDQGVPFLLDYRVVARDGRVVWIRDETRMVRDDQGKPLYRQGLILDISERMQAEEARRKSEAEFQQLFAANPLPMWVYDRTTSRLLEVNEIAVAHYGYSRDEFLGMTIEDIQLPDDGRHGGTEPDGGASPMREGSGQHRLKDGRLIDVEVTTHALDFGGGMAALVVAQDVTARNVLEARLAYQAFHDPLTGLPNRALFLDRLGHALDRGSAVAVFFLDIDDFKVVNDTLGHEAGDRLLTQVAERLRAGVAPGDTLARQGGDEFTVLVEGGPGAAQVERVAESLAGFLRPPFRVGSRDLFVSASVGIAIPTGGESPAELLRLADIAMYRAKQQGKARYAIFDPRMDERAWRRLELEGELRRALDANELRVHYQPVVELASGEVIAVEALVRWAHPTRGLVGPDEFISLAEETGLIGPLGQWVLREACRQAVAWQELSPRRPLSMAVNLSPKQFLDKDLATNVASVLDEVGLAPTLLELEVTEATAIEDVLESAATMRRLRSLGVRLVLDDFGAGYAGLGYLRRYPVDGLKIDRSFVAGLDRDEVDTAMVRAILAFAETIGLDVTAEGVETGTQRVRLRDMGCHRGQGFWFAPALPAEDLTVMLAEVTDFSSVKARITGTAGGDSD